MASTLKKTKPNSVIKKTKLKLVKATEKVELKNTFWKSTLFNDIYLDQDIYRQQPEMWDIDGDPDFESCMNGLLNLFSDWNEDHLSGWTEADTVAHWIKPILVCLGWVDEEKTALPHSDQAAFAVRYGNRLQTYFADILISDTVDDMSLYVDKKLTAEQRLEKAKGKVIIPLEAKYWNRINKQYAGQLNKKEEKEKNSEKVDAANRLGPNGQILKYMEILNLEWGFLSDGATWRLFNKELSSESEGRYLEFNIYNLYKRAQMALDNEHDALIFREATKFFYNFFSKKALFPKQKKQELVRRALVASKSYAEEVEEDLKERFVNAMNVMCNGLHRASGQKQNLEIVRTVAESHLFNILFIKSCEARNVLPLDANNYWEVSLSRMIDALHAFDPNDYKKSPQSMEKIIDEAYYWFRYKDEGHELFDALIRLTGMIHKGTNGKGQGFHIDGFRESVFSKDEWKFAKQSKLTNIEMVQTLFELGFAKSPKGSKRKFQEIPYQYFTPRQLGSIYESFLEYRLEIAVEDMAYVKRQWRKANLSSTKVRNLKVPKVRKKELFFTPDNKDRKATGSYYTPQYIVNHIVKETIEPLCKGKTSDEILNLKICDPAMGSGHFLNGALRYLTQFYLEAIEEEILDDITLTPEEVKRILLDKCIFGVDLNPRAVKLAQMSLWLESAHPGKKLERLSDQLRVGDSLGVSKENSFDWQNEFFIPKYFNGFDCIIGNPPYGGTLSGLERKTIAAELGWPVPEVDTYCLFMLLNEKILASRGRTGHILPSTWLYMPTFSDLRTSLLDSGSISRIVHLKYFVFSEATVETCLLFTKKDSNPSIQWAAVESQQLLFNNLKYNLLNTEKRKQGEDLKLILGAKAEDEKWEKIKSQNTELGTVTEVVCGLTPYRRGKGKPKQTEDIVKNKLYTSNRKVEKDYRQYIMGRDFHKFKWQIKEERWLKYGDCLAEPRYKAPFNEEKKIVVRQTSDQIIAQIDTNKYIDLKNVHNIKVTNSAYSYEFLLGVLNSSIVTWWYRKLIPETGRTFAEVKAVNLRKLPIPGEHWVKNNPKSVRTIEELTKSLLKANINKLPEDKICSLMNKLDLAVNKVYGFDKDKEERPEVIEKIAA